MDRHVLIVVSLLILPLTSSTALAHETDEGYGYEIGSFSDSPVQQNSPDYYEDPGRRLHKFELALRALKIPLEKKPDFTRFPRAGEASKDGFLGALRFIDPQEGLQNYLDILDNRIDLFRDHGDHLPAELLEYSVDVLSQNPSPGPGMTPVPVQSNDSPELMARLKQFGANARIEGNPYPLKDVRIAIDPGHMGNELWDDFTGKYVEITNKRKQVLGRVSEGQLTLWTAFLLANALEKLGADVMITRQDLAPVSRNDYKTYNHNPYLYQYFYDSLDGWMTKYLHLGDGELVKKIGTFQESKYIVGGIQTFPKTASEIQKLKTHLFVTGEDLEARAQAISNFHPDLTIDIHYDATFSNKLQNHTNDVEAYVPGNFAARETGSRGIRALAFRHALESSRWAESVNLASAVTQSVSNSLGIPLMDAPSLTINGTTVAAKVKEGVYARNLYITRRNLEGLVAYLECLHYDYDVYDPKTKAHIGEFYQLARKDKSSVYKGLSFKYPNRLEKVAAGIRDGIVQYFKNLPANPGLIQFEPEQLDHSPVDFNEKMFNAMRFWRPVNW